jgi:hypothetical protein
MKKQIFRSCMVLTLGLAASLTTASAEETPGLVGIWFTVVTPADCQTGAIIPNVPSFRGLYMFAHDGSLTNEAAFLVATPNFTPRRSSGLGAWGHTQGHMYAGTFRFFRYNPDGTFLALRKVSTTILLNDDGFTSTDSFQDYDANNNVLVSPGSTGCNVVSASRVE